MPLRSSSMSYGFLTHETRPGTMKSAKRSPSSLRRTAIFFLLLVIQLSDTNSAAQFDLSLGSVFRGNQTLRTQGGTFEVGFFSPPGSENIYLGIWFVKVSIQTIVWVANRNQPVTGDNASYALSVDGELQVLDSGGKVAWSSETKGRNVSGAVLQDSGNIVLKSTNLSDVWESFDFPGNTWLPNMKIGLGRKLVSWQSSSNPAEGPYSLQMLPSMEFVSMWNNSKQYWNTGTWNGHYFSNVPEMSNNTYFSFFFDESGFSWSPLPSTTRIPMFILDTDGEIKHEFWNPNPTGWEAFWSQPQDQCAVYGVCGKNGVCRNNATPFCSCPPGFLPANHQEWESNTWSSGCILKTPLNCKEGSSADGFVPLPETSFEGSFHQLLGDLDQSECRSACLRNCSCAAYTYEESSNNCTLLSEILLNGRTSLSISSMVYMRVPSSEIPRVKQGHSWKKWLVVGVACGSVCLFVCIAVGVFLRRSRNKASKSNYGLDVLEMFSFAQLQSATKNFTEKLGSGGFGTVYKGTLLDKSAVAVKLLQKLDGGEKQFRAEVVTMGRIQHVNLVRLRGFCSERSHRLLVYEYMPKGSLDNYLSKARSEPTKSKMVLDWSTRFSIALGTARGIAYLHEGCRDCIIHCDIKPENILLDDNFCPKVSDFGLAKLVGREFSRVLTTMRGTRGYLAPEWISGLPITVKADVYSFGMTLLEVVSGRRNIDASMQEGRQERFFPVWAAKQVSEGKVEGLADERLGGEVNGEELRRAVYAAVWCIQEEEMARPTMRKVVEILEGTLEIGAPPMPQSLVFLAGDEEEEDTSSTAHTSIPSPSWLERSSR